MNVPVSECQRSGVVEILARPNRSASLATLASIFAALASAVFAVSLFSFMQGNVYAPVFALADVVFVGSCLYAVWRRGDDYDRISLSADEVAIEVRRGTVARQVVYQTAWARVWAERDERRGAAGLYLGSHGRRTEVGSFLVDAERARLAALIKIRLGQARAIPGRDSIENVARGHTA